ACLDCIAPCIARDHPFQNRSEEEECRSEGRIAPRERPAGCQILVLHGPSYRSRCMIAVASFSLTAFLALKWTGVLPLGNDATLICTLVVRVSEPAATVTLPGSFTRLSKLVR